MRSTLPALILLALVPGLAPRVGGEDKEARPQPKEIDQLLGKYCGACHGGKKAQSGFALSKLHPDRDFDSWKRVYDRVLSRHMPPPDRIQPTAKERTQFLDWLEGRFEAHTLGGHPDPGPLRSRRLNVREHANSFRDLAVLRDYGRARRTSYAPTKNGTISLYGILPPVEHPCAFVGRILPADTIDGGFDTIDANLSIQPFLVEKYLRGGKTLLDEAFTQNARRAQSYQWPLYQQLFEIEKGPRPRNTTERQALATFLKDFSTRAFRRPVSAAEVEKYAKLYDAARDKGEGHEAAVRLPVQAILASPRFTVLWGAGGEAKQQKAVRPLDGYEVAARLATFLWSSVPDRDLLQAAAKGQLKEPKEIETQVRRMLKDQRVTTGLREGFLSQWLQLDRLSRNAPAAEKFPDYFKENLAELMKQELLLFTDAILVEDRSVLEFIDADWGFLCYPLAQHYGFEKFPGKKQPANAQQSWYRISWPNKRRGGVLTMGAVLTGMSQPKRTSPVHRGKWVLEAILGTPPPPPPPDVDNQLKEPEDEKRPLTVPQRLAKHRNNPSCAGCHRLIDPLGMALENFDPVGKWRDKDQGQAIDARGELTDGSKFDGVEELKKLLVSRKEEFVRCLAEKMLTYALGRKLEFYDVATVKKITRAVVQDDYKFSRLVVEVALSHPFRHRRVEQ